MTPGRIVIVGASAAGLTAAETLRREGHTGPLILIGDEPAAPYDRPPLSKEILSVAWLPDRLPLRASADLDALGWTSRPLRNRGHWGGRSGRFTAVYRTGDPLTGVLTLGMPPKTIRPWQQAIASRTPWHQAMTLAERAAA